MAPKKVVKSSGAEVYYVAVDGTDSIDSVAFGHAIEEFGVRNLVGELMKSNVAGEDDSRIEDPNHDFLPIWRVEGKVGDKQAVKAGKKKGVAVVCPCGFSSRRSPADAFWGVDHDNKRSTATTFMESFILNPGVVVKSGKVGLAAGTGATKADTIPCDILTLSSHGWLGGFMSGNSGNQWMIIGGTNKKKLKFEGPVWLILAQCSTVCIATWPSWVEVMARSDPPVRGVLAYEEVAPAAASAARFAKEFFGHLKNSKMTFIDAWKKVNDANGRSWAAVVHKDAKKDSLANWHLQKDLDKTELLKPLEGVYLGWSQTKDGKEDQPKGKPIVVKEPPFTVELTYMKVWAKRKMAIDESNLNAATLRTKVGRKEDPPNSGTIVDYARPLHYVVKVEPPPAFAGKPIREVTVEWIHIRKTKDRYDSVKLFGKKETVVVPAGVTTSYAFVEKGAARKSLYTFTVDKATTLSSLAVEFHPVDKLGSNAWTDDDHYPKDDKIVAHHSYLWLRISLKLDDAGWKDTAPVDFTTRGLVYYGGPTGDG
jgi:hypothetical protein